MAIALASAVPFAQGLLMIYYAKAGKFRCRDRILNFIDWKGQEAVLDVGTGRGLLLIGAAKRTTGRAVGIDLWSQEDFMASRRRKRALSRARVPHQFLSPAEDHQGPKTF